MTFGIPILYFVLVAYFLAVCNSSVHFTNVNAPGSVFDGYSRSFGPAIEITRSIRSNTTVLLTPSDGFGFPFLVYGFTGAAVLDYDGDGDEDFIVPNGPGSKNSLFKNLLVETGSLQWSEVAQSAGIAGLVDEDYNGVCYSDIDNDGDLDVLILDALGAKNQLFSNNGDGTFTEVADAGGMRRFSDKRTSGCSFGDLDGDGFSDVVIARSLALNDSIGCQKHQEDTVIANELYINQGGTGSFVEEGSIRNYAKDFPDVRLAWAVTVVDIDMDGDLDIVEANDQCAAPEIGSGVGTPEVPEIKRGNFSIFLNDGTGHFTDRTADLSGGLAPGAFMGLALADLNSDGTLDVFITNFGEYYTRGLSPAVRENQNTRHFLQTPGTGVFVESTNLLNDVGNTPFGWGCWAGDLDNDGGTDIHWEGGLDNQSGEATNGGAVILGDGADRWERDSGAFTGDVDHRRYMTVGVAYGDFNDDGYPDHVSVTTGIWNDSVSFTSVFDRPSAPPGFFQNTSFDSDPTPSIVEVYSVRGFIPPSTPLLRSNNIIADPGKLLVEMNDGGSNAWLKLRPVGSVGISAGARAPRDGIGAVFTVTACENQGRDEEEEDDDDDDDERRRRFSCTNSIHQMTPVTGGHDSAASQHSLIKSFGLGSRRRAAVETFWAGGVTNFFTTRNVRRTVTLPEIPCDVKGAWSSKRSFMMCVRDSLNDLRTEGIVTDGDSLNALRRGMRIGFDKYHP